MEWRRPSSAIPEIFQEGDRTSLGESVYPSFERQSGLCICSSKVSLKRLQENVEKLLVAVALEHETKKGRLCSCRTGPFLVP